MLQRTEARHNVLEPLNDRTRLVEVRCRFQSNQLFFEPFESGQTCRANLQDFFQRRRDGNLSFPDELFLKFLPWTHSHKPNWNVLSRHEPGQSDQVSGQVENLDLFPHVQNVDSTLLADRRGLENQLNCLRN